MKKNYYDHEYEHIECCYNCSNRKHGIDENGKAYTCHTNCEVYKEAVRKKDAIKEKRNKYLEDLRNQFSYNERVERRKEPYKHG